MVDSSPHLDPSELLVHAEWLQRLARSLVRDHGAAEDLVQDTWLSVLRSGPREGVRPRHWLARVLQNHLRSLERSTARRERREADIAPPELLPSTAELIERAESGRVLLDAVLGLPEAQRQVLLQSDFEALPVARIAALTGTSEVAVRSRIARAITALREEFDRRSGGDRTRWLAALVPLARTPGKAALDLTGAGSAGVLLGATTMTAKSKVVVAIAAVVALGLGLRVLGPHRPDLRPIAGPDPVSALDAGASSIQAASTGTAMVAPESSAASTRSLQVPAPIVDPPATVTNDALAGRVVDARTRVPVAGARVLVQDIGADDDFTGPPAKWELETDVEGQFHGELDSTSVVSVEVIGAGYVPQKLTCVVLGTDTEIELQPASLLVVEVRFDRSGDRMSLEPIVGAACQLVLDGHNHARRTIQHGLTDAHGDVAFASRGLQAHLVVKVPDRPVFVGIYELEPGQDRLQVVLQPVGEVSGRVIDKASGGPIAGATLTEFNNHLWTVTDSDGQFGIPHDHTENSFLTVTHPDYATVHQRILPQSNRIARIPDIELLANAVLVGQLIGFEGETQLNVVSKQSYFVDQRFRKQLSVPGAGPLRVAGVPPGEELVIEARDGHGHFGLAESRVAAPGETFDFGALVPTATATLHGRLAGLDPSKAAVVRVRVSRGELILRDLTRAVRGADYRITDLPTGKGEAWVEQEGTPGVVASVELIGAEVSLDLDLGGQIRGIVRDESGEGVRDAAARLLVEERAGFFREETARCDAAGRFVRAGLGGQASYQVSILTFGGEDGEVSPKVIENVVPGGPPLEFTLRPNAWTITGTVNAAILEAHRADKLSVEGNSESEEVEGTVRDDGTFSLSVPHPGPWNLQLWLILEGPEELDVIDLSDVDEIRNAHAGVPVEFRRK